MFLNLKIVFIFVSEQLKNARHIFIFISVFAMALTVFQYIPILEEESGPDTELCKKTDDSSGDDDTCDDDTNESKDDQINETYSFRYFKELASRQTFYIKSELYNFIDANITTPPPRV